MFERSGVANGPGSTKSYSFNYGQSNYDIVAGINYNGGYTQGSSGHYYFTEKCDFLGWIRKDEDLVNILNDDE